LYGHNNLESVFKKSKIRYYAPNVWRLMYLIKGREVYHYNPKRMWSRSSHIPSMFRRYKIFIHAGKRWYCRFVSRWMIGFRAGEFSWNRRLAIYKAKQLRKKNKKLLKDKAKTERLNSKPKIMKVTKSKQK
jgi:ribosomal protein S19